MRIAFFVAGAVAAVALLTILALQEPSTSLVILGIATAIVVGSVVRSMARPRLRVVLLGLTLGSGSLLYSAVGTSSGLILLALVVSALPPWERPAGWRAGAFATGAILMLVGLVGTAQSFDVPAARWTAYVSLVAAGLWLFTRAPSTKSGATTVLATAGLTAAAGVYLAALLGRPVLLADQTASLAVPIVDSRVAGLFAAPNEVAIVLAASVLAMLAQLVLSPGRSGLTPTVAMVALVLPALVLTGSRTAILGTLAGFLVMLLPRLARRPLLAIVSASVAVILFWTLQSASVFAGRGLNLFAAEDPSAIYRRSVQGRLWSRIDSSLSFGYGFVDGNRVSTNAFTADINNIDNAWLYGIFGAGIIFTMGVGLLFLTAALTVARLNLIVAIGVSTWFIAETSAEDLWGLGTASICAILVFSAAREALLDLKESSLRGAISSPPSARQAPQQIILTRRGLR